MGNCLFTKIFLFVESRCNFNCKHCFTKKSNRRLSYDQVKEFLKWLEDSGCRLKTINVAGSGNPVLNPELPQILSLISDYAEIEASINVRGAIPASVVGAIKEHDILVAYSIDRLGWFADEFSGFPNLHKIQTETLDMLIDKEIKTTIRTTIMRDNYFDVLRIIGFVDKLDDDLVSWSGMPMIPYSSEDLSRVPTDYQLLRIFEEVYIRGNRFIVLHPAFSALHPYLRFKHKCRHPWLCEVARESCRICLKEDGYIYMCPFDTQPLVKFRPDLDVEHVWQIIRNRVEYAPMPKKCKDCFVKDCCGGGCMVSRLNVWDVVCPISLIRH